METTGAVKGDLVHRVVGGRLVRVSVLGVAVLGAVAPAYADVEGTAPAKVGNWRLYGGHSALGAALMVPGPSRAEVNSVLLPSATSEVTDLPYDAEVAAAYLFWSGSLTYLDRSGPPDPPDREVDFTAADGTFYNDLSVDTDYTGFGRCATVAGLGGFFYCRRDVTDLIQAQGPGNANGIYSVGDLRADPGTFDPSDPQFVNSQAKYANWSLVIVWKAASETVRRDVVLYDGFLRLDEVVPRANDPTPLGVYSFTVADFVVGSPALGRLTVFAMEGDRQLGVPPQDLTGCPSCWDGLSFRAQSAASPTMLANGMNPRYNSFNSSSDVSTDIDTYSLGGLIGTGDTSATLTMLSGDGAVDVAYNQGNGESFNVGWVVMTIDTLTPNFAGSQTRKTVLPANAGPGQRLYYLIDVVNQGSAAATGVVVKDSIPAGSRYLAGSTRVNGVPRADVGGTSPLLAGLSLGTIGDAHSGGNSRQVTFEVEVEAAACGGVVDNYATVLSNETDPVTLGPARTTVSTSVLDPPTKAVAFVSAPPVGPGSTFAYTIDLGNSGSSAASGVKVSDPLPPYVRVASVLATSGGWSLSGNTLTVTNIDVPASGSAQVVVVGLVLSVAELQAAGVSESSIDGLLVSNQATVSGGCAPDQVTDDPESGGLQPTTFSLTYAPILGSSSKTGVDLNGGALEPGDVIRYTVTARNTGNRAVEVVLTDGIPANTSYVPGSTKLDGLSVPDVGGTSALLAGYSLGILGYVGDNDRVVSFEVSVPALAANGAVVTNQATLSVPQVPAAGVQVSSAPLVVRAAPDLSTSTKTVLDQTAPFGVYIPGDLVTYTITVVNSGNRPATNVAVQDELPVEVEVIAVSGGGVVGAGSVSWPTRASLAAGGTLTYTIQARLAPLIDNGVVVTNLGRIACAELVETTVSAGVTITSGPHLAVTKIDVHPSSPPRPGDGVSYRIRIENDGTAIARDLQVTDDLDVSLTNVSAPGASVSGRRITWSAASDARLASLLPGAANSIELVVSAALSSPLANGTVVANQAAVAALGIGAILSDDPDVGGSADPTTFVVVSQATLSFSKRVEDRSPTTPYQPGDRVRYTLTLTAGGDAPLTDVVVTDPVDTALGNVSVSGGSTRAGVVTWSAATGSPSLSRLSPGQGASLVFEAVIGANVADATVVSNQAQAASVELGQAILSDGDAAAAGAQPTRFQVVSKPRLALVKAVALVADANGEFNPGDTVAYTLTLSNRGTAAATGVVLTDTFDGRLTLTDAAGGVASGNLVTWAFVDALAPGASRTVVPQLKIARPLDNGVEIGNQGAVLCAEAPGPEPSDDPSLPGTADVTVFRIRSRPDFSRTTKTVTDITGDPLVTRPGDRLAYTVVVENSGDADADLVVVEDPLSPEVTVAVPANARLDGNRLLWDVSTEPALARLAAGAAKTLTFEATVNSPLANGTRVANQAAVHSDEVALAALSDDPATAAVDDETVVNVVSTADLGASTKTVTSLTGVPIVSARPNTTVRYTITVVSRGDAPATNVVVNDAVHSALDIVSAPGGSIDAGAHAIRFAADTTPALASLAPGANVVLTFDARLQTPLDDGLVIANQGSISAAGIAAPVLTDANPTTLAKEETLLTVTASPDLSGCTAVFVNPGTGQVLSAARPGDAVRMLITLVNRGDGIARGVRVTDTVDLSLLTNVTVRDGGALAGNVASFSVAEVRPGTDVQLRIDARLRSPLDPTTLVNQAAVLLGSAGAILTDDPAQPGTADPTRLPILSAATLDLSTKDVVTAVGGGIAGPGETITYSIDVRNTGDANAHDVVLTDALSTDLELVAASGNGVYDPASRKVVWSAPLVAGGGHLVLTVTARVQATTPNGRVIENRGELAGQGLPLVYTDDRLTGTPDSPTRVTVRALPSFSVFQKVVELLDQQTPGRLAPGDRLRYTLILQNKGNAAATNVEVRDLIDPTLLTELSPVTPFTVVGNEVVFDAATVPALALVAPEQRLEVVFEARVVANVADSTPIANQAFVSSAEVEGATSSDDPATSAPQDATTVTVRYPQLELVKSVRDLNGGEVWPGDSLAFTISVKNRGSVTASDVVVSDALTPEAVSLLTAIDAPGATHSGQTYKWTLRELAAGAVATVGLDARVAENATHGASATNRASAKPNGAPEATSNVVSFAVVSLPRLEDATLIVSSASRRVAPEEILTYTFVIPNKGQAAATDVVVTDALDPTLEIIALSDGGIASSQSASWRLGSIGVGETRRLELQARVRADAADGVTIANQGFITARQISGPLPTDDPGTVAPDDPTTVAVVARPALAKSTLQATDLNGGVAAAGDRIRYELVVHNTGTIRATGVGVRLALPPYTGYVAGSTQLNGVAIPDAGGQAPVLAGVPLQSGRGDAAPGVVLADDLKAPQDELAVLSFEVQLDPRVLPGVVISAQAEISCAELPLVLSDNPATDSVSGDPTLVVVGGGAELVVTKSVELLRDLPPNGRADVGDRLRYVLSVTNGGDGTAAATVLVDRLPATLSVPTAALALQGRSLTVAAGDDDGEISADGVVTVRLGELARGQGQRVVVDADIGSGPVVVNQAEVTSGSTTWLSDADPMLAGIQATVTVVDSATPLLDLSLTANDENGGVVEASDKIAFALEVVNRGATAVHDVILEARRPTLTAAPVVAASERATLTSADPPAWTLSTLGPGERVRLSFESTVNPDATSGDVVATGAEATLTGASFASPDVELMVGGGVGTGGFSGRIFRDHGVKDGVYTEGQDEALTGFSVLLVPESRLGAADSDAEPSTLAVRSIGVGRDGKYRLVGVPVGRYQLWAAAADGAMFAASPTLAARGGSGQTYDLAVDPSGIVYQEVDGAALPVAGARVFLVDFDTGQDLPRTAMFGGQQGQVTTGQGFYRFDVRASALPRRLYIRIEPPSASFVFPSVVFPPEGVSADSRWGSPATADAGGRIVPSDIPDLTADHRYFLRFDLDAGSPNYTNNHIPIDRLDQHIKLVKQASRRTAQIGEIVTYSVRITNPLDREFVIDDAGQGGVWLVDDFPEGMQWARDEASVVTTIAGGASEPRRLGVRSRSGKTIVFQALSLPARSVVTVRYYAVVGVRAKGEQTNRARLVDAGNVRISNEASATVRIVADPIFDQGTVLGRVFCDDGNGAIDAAELGLPGARVYLDNGYYVDTDIEGKFHFRGVDPGRHLIKIDLNSTPPGTTPATDVRRDFYVSRGLLAKINFGLRCAWSAARPTEVTLKTPPPPAPAGQSVVLMVDRLQPGIALDGAAQALPLVDAVLTAVGDAPDLVTAGVEVPGPTALVWHTQVADAVRIVRWEISVFADDGREVWRVGGDGRPPARIPWQILPADQPLTPGASYTYRIAAQTVEGDLGEGRWRQLSYQLGGATPAAAAAPTVWNGLMFEPDSDTPTTLAKDRVRELVTALRKQGPLPALTLEAHTYFNAQRSANLLLSQRQAVALRALLVAAGYPEVKIRAVGKGDTEPLAPSVTRKARELNRRVVLKTEQPVVVRAAPPPAPEYAGVAIVNGEAQILDEQRFERELPVDVGTAVRIDLRQQNGRRVRVTRVYPFAQVASGDRPSVTLEVAGSVTDGSLRIGSDTVPLALAVASCDLENGALGLSATGLEPPARFKVRAAVPLRSWLVRILNPEGTVLNDLSGEGDPPEIVTWNGRSNADAVVVRPATYSYRCLLTDLDGNRVVSARRPIMVGGAGAKPTYAKTLRGELYPRAEGLQAEVLRELDLAAAAASGVAGARLRVEVHDTAAGGKLQAQIRTARLAAAFKAALVARGVAESSIDAVAVGGAKPLMAGAGRRADEMNRRVSIEVVAAAAPELLAIVETPAAPHAKVAGTALPVDASGTFAGTVVVDPDAVLLVDLLAADGRSGLFNVPIFDGKPLGAAVTEIPQGRRPKEGEPRIGSDPASLRAPQTELPEPVAAAPASGAAADNLPVEFHESLTDDGGVDAVVGWRPAMPTPHLAPPNGPPRLVEANGPPRLVEANGPPRLVEANGSPHLVDARPGGSAAAAGEAGAVTNSAATALAEVPAGTLAASLEVWLPADGATLSGERLTVYGRSAPENTVRLNGEVLGLDDDGRFMKTLVLPTGPVRVDVSAEDQDGNSAHVARSYQVPDSEWFLLAMGDGVAGRGQGLEGMNRGTTWDSTRGSYPDSLPDDLYLHGRAVGYFKGRVKGAALFAANPFREVRLSAHLDTGKAADADLVKQLIDPERYYPVYGDAATEVQDVSSRSKIYVLVEADRSRAIVGNFSTKLDGLELFRFQRSYFGAAVDLDHEFVAGSRSQAHALVASGQNGVRHRQVALQGTGGSMYFLRDGELVEGSERVELVVRDAVTGMRLQAVPQTRDVDYSISYREGRLVFSAPVPSVALAGWRLNQNASRTLDGNPVFAEIEYDYRSPALDQGDKAMAVQVRQGFGDRVIVGGGAVSEDRTASGGSKYELYGVDFVGRISKTTRVTAELAYSKATDGDHLASYDGGVTYGTLGASDPLRAGTNASRLPANAKGRAGKLTLAGDLGEFLPRPSTLPAAAEFLAYNLYYQFQDPFFYSGNTVFEQGQTKVGGQLRASLSEVDSVRLRHDGVWSRLFLGDVPRDIDRQITTLTYEHRGDGWRAGSEIGHTYWDDGARAVNTDGVSLFGERKLLPRLTLTGEQQLLVRADSRVVDAWNDRLVSSVSARYQLGERLYATANESLRWSGANSAQLGLKTNVMDDVNLYAAERLTTTLDGRTVSTSVVGGESTAIPGSRSYAEYQLDALASGQSGRAVFGMDNKWSLLDGVTLNLSYERAQLLGAQQSAAGGVGSAVNEPSVTGYGATPLGPTQQFTASGYSSAGVFPVGVSSRDAFATGLELLRAKSFKAGLRFEMRYDRGDAQLGAHDRLVFFGQAGADWRLDRYLVVLGRARGAAVQNLDFREEAGSELGFAEGQYADVSLGVALRPVHTDFVNGLFKWTRRYERRPVNVELTQFQLEIADVIAAEAAFELGGGLQLVNKVAVKVFEVQDAELTKLRATTLLAIVRLNYHLTDAFDAGAEYRWLGDFLTREREHGPLFELAWIPVPYAAVGVGYNFTRFSEDLLADPRLTQHGLFLRVTARY